MLSSPLNEKADSFFAGMIRTSPARSNQASGLAWPVRHLILKRIGWEYATPVSVSTQKRFTRGIETEKFCLNQLLPGLPGVVVRGTGLSVEHKPAQIAGRIDAEISVDGEVLPVEIKSLQYFSRYRSAQDFREGGLFTENYYYQLNTYLFCSNREHGLFMLIDPTSYDVRFLDMVLDLEAMEGILKKCEVVNGLVRKWEGRDFRAEDIHNLPDCSECSPYCQFQALCGRDAGAKVSDFADLDLEKVDSLAARKLELAEAAKEYDAVGDELKALVRGHETIISSRFMITGGEVNMTVFTVPKELKDQYAEKRAYWKIKKIIAL